jgi:phosphatidylglycerol---prolipoprotein diacylglyceryl transferase
MRRILYVWKGFEFYSYTVMLYFGLLAGIIVGNQAAHHLGIDPFRVFIAQYALIPLGFIGGRAMFAASCWSAYSKSPGRLLHFNLGGSDQFGAYALTIAGSVLVVNLLKIPFLDFWDINILSLLTLMFVTRFGCLLNGCCSGRVTHSGWGMKLSNHKGVVCYRIPIQLLEAGWTVIVIVSSVLIWPSLGSPGALFCFASASYCIGRIALDGFREECCPWLGPITVHQGIYSLLLVFCCVLLIVIWT